jgi:hypothetical protein
MDAAETKSEVAKTMRRNSMKNLLKNRQKYSARADAKETDQFFKEECASGR